MTIAAAQKNAVNTKAISNAATRLIALRDRVRKKEQGVRARLHLRMTECGPATNSIHSLLTVIRVPELIAAIMRYVLSSSITMSCVTCYGLLNTMSGHHAREVFASHMPKLVRRLMSEPEFTAISEQDWRAALKLVLVVSSLQQESVHLLHRLRVASYAERNIGGTILRPSEIPEGGLDDRCVAQSVEDVEKGTCGTIVKRWANGRFAVRFDPGCQAVHQAGGNDRVKIVLPSEVSMLEDEFHEMQMALRNAKTATVAALERQREIEKEFARLFGVSVAEVAQAIDGDWLRRYQVEKLL